MRIYPYPRYLRWLPLLLSLWLVLTGVAPAFAAESAAQYRCPPTAADEMGPFYRPEAPLRSSIGQGYLLQGQVLSAADCRPVNGARIEAWQAAPGGRYDDAHRATLFSAPDGYYRLATDPPPPYVSRPPHIHLRISATGFATLVTQHYVQKGIDTAVFDLTLVPQP